MPHRLFTDRRSRRGGVLVASIGVAMLAACSSGSGSGSSAKPSPSAAATTVSAPGATDAPATTPAPTPTTAAPAPTEAPAATNAPVSTEGADEPISAGWAKVDGGPGCQCADGGDYNLWVREADPAKVMLYFQGGGACFSREMCDFANARSYDMSVTSDDDPTASGGIFDFANPANPFADWSVVFVPYCTGDVHLGDKANDYGDGLVVEHRGAVNAKFGFDEMVRRFPAATDVFVTGSSAGGVPSPLYAGYAADAYPQARVTALADGSGAYPSVPGINAAIGALWGTFRAKPTWPELASMTPEEWSIPGLFTVAGKHAPTIRLARHDHAFDEVQAAFSAIAGIDASEEDQLILDNAAAIEAAGVEVDVWLAPGKTHTILLRDDLYTQQVNGVSFISWLTSLVNFDPVDDNVCTTCT